MAEEDTINKMSSDTQEMKHSVDKEEIKASVVSGKEDKVNQETKQVPPENGIHKLEDETSKTEELVDEEKAEDTTKGEKDEDAPSPHKLNEHSEPSKKDSQDKVEAEESLKDSKESKDVSKSSEDSKEELAKESNEKPVKESIEEESKDPHGNKVEKKESNDDEDESLDDSKEETHVESMEESVEEPVKDDEPSEMSPKKRQRGKAKVSNTPPADTPTRAKRDRKKVERFVQETKKEEVEVEGTGTYFREIPYIKNMLSKSSPDDLKNLHRLAYGRPGAASDVKRNLYKFRGFPFSKDDKAFERKKTNTERLAMAELKKIASVLGLEKKGVKMEVVERILDFLLYPCDSGKAPRTPKPKRRQSKSKSKKSSNKRTSKKKKQKKDEGQSADESGSEEEKSDSDEEQEDEEEEEEEEDEKEEEEEEEEDSGAESEPEEVKKPKKKSKPAPKKTPKSSQKASKKRAKDQDSEDGSEDSSNVSSENPKKKSKKAPTDGDIKAFIKKLLDKANLEEVTMKKLCQQVYDNYPDQDLSHKKEFIKSTVKSILS